MQKVLFAHVLGQGLVVAWHWCTKQTLSSSQRPLPPGIDESWAQHTSPSPQAPFVPLWQLQPFSRQSPLLQCSSCTQRPGPPGRPGLSGQQIRSASQAPSVPPSQRHPWLVQPGAGPSGLQPTDEGVHVPGLPGGPAGSFLQQTRVVSPQGFCVPVAQGQPAPGRAGSVQTGSGVGVGAWANTVVPDPFPSARKPKSALADAPRSATRRVNRPANVRAMASKRSASTIGLRFGDG